MVEEWGIEEFDPNSRRLTMFDFSPTRDGSLRAYPVFMKWLAPNRAGVLRGSGPFKGCWDYFS